MKLSSSTRELIIVGFLLAPFLYLALVWPQLPDIIATHFDAQGRPNDWMAKTNAVLLMGGSSLFLYLLLRFLPRIDPRNQLQTGNYQKLRLFIALCFAGITGWLWYAAANPDRTESLTGLLLALVGVMIAGTGNYLTTVKPNWFVGIRTPWTLSSDTVWRRTHQLGGKLMVAGGLLGSALALLLPAESRLWAFLAVVLLSSFVPVVYSYVYFQQEKAR
jgi:uncharacterized membrane protein